MNLFFFCCVTVKTIYILFYPFRGMDDKFSLFRSLSHIGCQTDYEKFQIMQSKRLFLKYHAAGIISTGL